MARRSLHCGISIRRMTGPGQERRISAVCNISASLLKADVERTFDHRGFVPDSDMAGVKPFAYSREVSATRDLIKPPTR